MTAPDISAEDLRRLLPAITEVSTPFTGGQKRVFPCVIDGVKYVVKVLGVPVPAEEVEPPQEDEERTSPIEEIFARAKREVDILAACDSPHLPKIGPIPLTRIDHNAQNLLVFSEEFIEGVTLTSLIVNGSKLSPKEVVNLGLDLNRAIGALWLKGKVHRDIKPDNILRRTANGQFVLIDPGIAYDVAGTELTQPGNLWRTAGYIAPELINLATRRDADSRSDFFLVGTVMYRAASGVHPFGENRAQEDQIIGRILTHQQPRISTLFPDFPICLDEIIERLLSKQKHGRYRNSRLLEDALNECARGLQ